MLHSRLYYRLKPFLPRAVRVGVRRWFAVRKRQRVSDVWPILPGSETPPAGWLGWPEGKQFAFVLTHDVEGPEGLAKVRRLAELEMKLGFRSSFNFIPEGTYRVPDELRQWLVDHGFEVGVHDLYHDGRLFSSRARFPERAAAINRYLKSWGAVGFRSGFMLNQLDWIHHLDIQYDASTFDTDPFEPQPQGQNTIFPFWIPAPDREKAEGRRPKAGTSTSGSQPSAFSPQPSGFVELPYTLPQDSTLFLLLRESGPEIWLRKLAWIVKHGGLALVNVHPDYVRFNGERATAHAAPVCFYERLLGHVREVLKSDGWGVLPRQVAEYVQQLKDPLTKKSPLRVSMVAYSHYTRDNRIIRYAESLARRGDQVEVLGLRHTVEDPAVEWINGVKLVRLQDRLRKDESSPFRHLVSLLRFWFKCGHWLRQRQPYLACDLCHVHNVPDFLVFAAWSVRRHGGKLILDIHDVVPELYAAKFRRPFTKWMVRGLLRVERWSARFADHVILANHLWLDRYVRRTGAAGRCSVMPNYVNTDIFFPRPRTRSDHKTVILFPGGLQWHQGLDIAIRAVARLRGTHPEVEFHIYGDGPEKDRLQTLARQLDLNGNVRFFAPVRSQQIAAVMANADLAVVPKRADSFGNEAHSTKILEFMALGIPVVAAATKIDRATYDESVIRFFEPGNPGALAEAMSDVLGNAAQRQQMVTTAAEFAATNAWANHQADYLRLVDSLCSR